MCATDPFFVDKKYFTGKVPADSSINHDYYLYEFFYT
jgi:hypothetical protein